MLKIRTVDAHRGVREYVFRGPTRIGVKREVLSYWYRNRSDLDMSLDQFLTRCRMSIDK